MKALLFLSCSALAMMASPAIADPFSAAVALISTGISVATTAGGIAAFSFLGLSGLAAVGATFAVRAALGYALNALSSSSIKAPEVSRGYQNVNQLGTALPHQIIYGETRIGGAVFYQTLTTGTSTNDRLHRLIAFAGHEIESYEAIYLNDDEVTIDENGDVTAPSQYVGKVRIKQYLGTDDQLADDDLVSEVIEWTNNHRARGIAYLYVRFEDAGADAFQAGVPLVTAKTKGKKIFDPRISTTAWSNNPALCIYDYLVSEYGLQETAGNINQTLFEDAADACDAIVLGAPIYTCNGSFTLDADPEGIIRNLLSSMGGIFWNYAGQWSVLAAEYRAPTLTLDENDLRSELQIATRHSRRDNFNAVRGQYKGAATDYQPDDYEEVSAGLFLAEDNDIRSATELSFLFTDTEIMARRISKTFLRRNRQQITITGAFGLRALDLKVGDNVMLSLDHMGWTQKVFEVVDWRLGMKELDIQVNMILREMSEEVFTGITATVTDESNNDLQDESGNILEAVVA
jgi:hypothetical protein